MKSLSGKELAKVLDLKGWQLRRIQGSHHIYGKEDSVVRLLANGGVVSGAAPIPEMTLLSKQVETKSIQTQQKNSTSTLARTSLLENGAEHWRG